MFEKPIAIIPLAGARDKPHSESPERKKKKSVHKKKVVNTLTYMLEQILTLNRQIGKETSIK